MLTDLPAGSQPPDDAALGFLSEAPEPLRYDGHRYDPYDAAGRVVDFIAANSRVLEVGCGTGSLAMLIRDLRTPDIIGIEPDPARASAARERGLNVVTGLFNETFVQSHGRFDAIVFADVLEHVSNPGELIQRARRALNPGGCVIISVPNIAHYFVRLDLLRGRFEYQTRGIMDATHLRWFTRSSLFAFLYNLQLRVVAYAPTANIGLDDYRHRIPWRWIPASTKRRLVAALMSIWPTLFGCQHVVKAVAR